MGLLGIVSRLTKSKVSCCSYASSQVERDSKEDMGQQAVNPGAHARKKTAGFLHRLRTPFLLALLQARCA